MNQFKIPYESRVKCLMRGNGPNYSNLRCKTVTLVLSVSNFRVSGRRIWSKSKVFGMRLWGLNARHGSILGTERLYASSEIKNKYKPMVILMQGLMYIAEDYAQSPQQRPWHKCRSGLRHI
jgi:hypothetical protein